MIDSRFKEHFANNDPDVELIMGLMLHPQKEEARIFLNFVNDIMNYYMIRSEGDNVLRLPLLYIPHCKPWAQEICVEFIALKISLLYNDINKIRLLKKKDKDGRFIVIAPPHTMSPKEKKFLKKCSDYARSIYNAIKDKDIPNKSTCNLLICRQFKESTPYNPYLGDYCGNKISRDLGSYALTVADMDIKKLGNSIKKGCCDGCTIENVFVFLSKSIDGHISEEGYSYQRSMIEWLNRSGAGIKNVFYFYFSCKPYKLQRLYSWKLNYVVEILQQKIENIKEFISLTHEESDYIFGREQKQIEYIVKVDEDYKDKDLKDYVDAQLEESCEYGVQVRNELALCCNKDSQLLFKKNYENVMEFTRDIDEFLSMIETLWKCNNGIMMQIISFLENCEEVEVALVLDQYVPDGYKEVIRSLFEDFGLKVSIHGFDILKCKKGKNDYLPCNQFDKIIVLSYRAHYVGRPYNRYPNSFDPICLGNGQELLTILNCFAFDPYYTYHKFEYFKKLQTVLTSEYRDTHLKCVISLPTAPANNPGDWTDKWSSNQNLRSTNRNIQKYEAISVEGNTIKLTELDIIICREEKDYSSAQILSVPDFYSLIQNSEQTYSMFQLSILQDKLEPRITKSANKIKGEEMLIRKKNCYELSEDEINSNIELWKILLHRQVDKKSLNTVYNEIMEKVPELKRIRMGSFEQWYNYDNNMILPRDRMLQDTMFEYLSIEKPYYKIIRRKKVQKGTMTEQKNAMLRTFLCDNLFANDFEMEFKRLNEEVKDLLDINSVGDLDALIDLLKTEIKFVEIKSLSKK